MSLGWKVRMREVEARAAAVRFLLGVLDGVGSMVVGSMGLGGARVVVVCREDPMVSGLRWVFVVLRGVNDCFRGVL